MKIKTIILFLFLVIGNLFSQQGGYVDKLSVKKGESIKFMISTSSSSYNIKFYKLGGTDQLIFTSPSITGGVRNVPANSYSDGCNWPVSYQYTIPTSWSSGVYAARFPVSNGENGEIIFAVKEQVPGSFSRNLVLLSTNTWQAYNNFGGKSLYDFNSSNSARSYKVSFNRPFTTATQYDFYEYVPDLYNWMNSKNIKTEFAVNYDFETNPNLLDDYDVVIFAGHDEYWSLKEKNIVEHYINEGGKVIYLAGNTCWWQVRFEDNNRSMVCYKAAFTLDPMYGVNNSVVTSYWYAYPVNNPENDVLGVSFRNGGYVDFEGHLTHSQGYTDYAAYNTHHWVYEGSGLKDGDEYGYQEKIVGYEVDGAEFTWQNGIPYPTGVDGTPHDFRILALSPSVQLDVPAVNPHAVMGLFVNGNGGAIFNFSTTYWVHGLTNPVISKITENVFRRFIEGTFPPEINTWSPANVTPTVINHENVFKNNRNNISLTGDSLKFTIGATDPLNGTIGYIWKLNNAVVSTNPTYTLYKNVPTGSYTVTAHVYNSTDTSSISWTVSVVNNITYYSVSGKVTYDNAASTPLSGIKVKLIRSVTNDTLIAVTDNNGNYTISNAVSGTYTLTAVNNSPFASGSVNATDALVTSRHYAGLTTLIGLKLIAGDVNNSAQVDNTDALMILRRYAGLTNIFPIPDWLTESKQVIIISSSLTNQNLKFISAGDVDGSF